MIDASLRADVSENKIFQITFENVFRKLASAPSDNDNLLEDNKDEVDEEDTFDIQEKKTDMHGNSDTLTLIKRLLLRSK